MTTLLFVFGDVCIDANVHEEKQIAIVVPSSWNETAFTVLFERHDSKRIERIGEMRSNLVRGRVALKIVRF